MVAQIIVTIPVEYQDRVGGTGSATNSGTDEGRGYIESGKEAAVAQLHYLFECGQIAVEEDLTYLLLGDHAKTLREAHDLQITHRGTVAEPERCRPSHWYLPPVDTPVGRAVTQEVPGAIAHYLNITHRASPPVLAAFYRCWRYAAVIPKTCDIDMLEGRATPILVRSY